ncbi:MAG: Uma2 family endonuclease [Gemmataceae bacterium]|nr:Uma2 family endonuclease [Gemmataceae bacterium]
MSALTIPAPATGPAAPPSGPTPGPDPAPPAGGPDAAPHPIRWTLGEFYRLAEAGFFAAQKVMLIEGRVLVMPPMKQPHACGVSLAEQATQAAFGPGFYPRAQQPLELGLSTDPEPDVAVVPGGPRDYLVAHPTTAPLVIEVAETSLAYDAGAKSSLYAAGGITDYWVIDVVHGRVFVFRDPRQDPTAPHGSSYFQRTTLVRGDTIVPLAAPNATVAVADLLP